jgi:CheY-like chemotaxis protein
LLERSGYVVLTATDGQSSLETLEKNSDVALIVLDTFLFEDDKFVSGYSVYQSIRANFSSTICFVILQTYNPNVGSDVEYFQQIFGRWRTSNAYISQSLKHVGIVAHFMKPFSPPKFVDTIKELLPLTISPEQNQ